MRGEADMTATEEEVELTKEVSLAVWAPGALSDLHHNPRLRRRNARRDRLSGASVFSAVASVRSEPRNVSKTGILANGVAEPPKADLVVLTFGRRRGCPCQTLRAIPACVADQRFKPLPQSVPHLFPRSGEFVRDAVEA